MRVRVYLSQEAEHPLVHSVMRSLASHRGSMVPVIEVAGQTVHWSEKFGVPVIRFQSPSPDDGCQFLRQLAETSLPPNLVKIRDYLPVPAQYAGSREGIYGDDVACGRVTAMFANDVPVAQHQLRGSGALPCLKLYLEMRTDKAQRVGDWAEHWWRHDLTLMRWI